jgi:hypothetical protein
MEITIHQHLIEQCVSMACASKANRDKVLWLGMARSWVRLADEVARAEIAHVANGAQERHYADMGSVSVRCSGYGGVLMG